jgi:hypothetical protein
MKRLIGNASVYPCAWLDAIPARWDGHWHRYGQWGCRLKVCRPWVWWGD